MLLALAAGVLSVLGGAFMPPLLIPAAAAIGFIGNAYGTLYCGIALAVSLGGIAALLSSNVLTMLCIAGFVLLSSVTLGIGLRKRLPYRLLAVLVLPLFLQNGSARKQKPMFVRWLPLSAGSCLQAFASECR